MSSEIDLEAIADLHVEVWKALKAKLKKTDSNGLELALSTVFPQVCAYLRGQLVEAGKNKRIQEMRGTSKLAGDKNPAGLPNKFEIVAIGLKAEELGGEKVLYIVESGLVKDPSHVLLGNIGEKRTNKWGDYWTVNIDGKKAIIVKGGKGQLFFKEQGKDGTYLTVGKVVTGE